MSGVSDATLRAAPLVVGVIAGAKATDPTEALSKSLRVFRRGEAEHHEKH
jgi:hypothetical protein